MTIFHEPISLHSGYVSTRWYVPGDGLAAGAAVTTGAIRLVPFPIYIPVTISDLGLFIKTAAAGGLASIGVYANNQATCRPTGNVLAQALNLTTTNVNVGVSAALGANVTLNPGWYWAASQVDVTGTLAAMLTYSAITSPGAWMMGTTTINNCRDALALAVTQAYGAFPDMTSATIFDFVSASNALPLIKVA